MALHRRHELTRRALRPPSPPATERRVATPRRRRGLLDFLEIAKES